MRLLVIFIVLALVMLAPFLLFADRVDQYLDGAAAVEFLRGFGAWAGLVGAALLAADLAAPVPATSVIAALGILFGPFIGGLYAMLGATVAGLLGYAIGRLLGPRRALWLLGRKDYRRARRFFTRYGGWSIVISRYLPIFPEALSILAGLSGMRLSHFVGALACGVIPMAMIYALVGHLGADRPMLTFAIAALIPIALWPVARWVAQSYPSAARTGCGVNQYEDPKKIKQQSR